MHTDQAKVQGTLTPVPPSGWRRVVAALTLWSLLRACWRTGAWLLAAREHAELSTTDAGLRLTISRQLLGVSRGQSETLIAWSGLREVAMVHGEPGRGLTVGLVAVTLGTYVGTGLVAQGLRAPGGAVAVIGAGLVLVACGACLDFVVSQGWLFAAPKTNVSLLVRRSVGPALRLRLDGIEPAELLLKRVEASLRGGESDPSTDAVSGAESAGAESAHPA